ncbi:phosphoribosylamine--glycine ligase [Desulfovibrio sp.]|uniref:phosphoribosylamine--glycine ligase n=1 Tax=Desulfovibrio sp. TaxID=885 RepID=UPI0023CA1008|nr:phosphoribosylamine--glycine ligase [Desulfovibrio sp.]MDE7240759.1 phosphoribosylamine--glycine ligase [Desulfovibrio sp.]
MRILVIGSGGREHALAWKLGQIADAVFVAPGNGGTEGANVRNVAIAVDDLDALVDFCRRERIDLVVPGPELPLTLGVTDRMAEAGIPCFGPDAYCARMEGSKSFAKEVMAAAGVPTAACAVFTDADAAREHIRKSKVPPVIKADGLAAGKGVVVAKTTQEALEAVDAMLEDRAFGAAGARILLEERLDGEEVSLLCLCDGERATPLPSAQDHKAAWDNDEGPNTGGMGAYSPAPVLPDERLEELADLTVRPVLRELARRGHPFRGVLYAGLMMTPDGPKVLEYNVRFGDPECQPLLMRLEGDLAALMLDCVQGKLDPAALSWSDRTALGVVLASKGYPGSYRKGMPIEGLDEADALSGVKVFHSGTRKEDGKTVSAGGRVLCVTALGDDLSDARAKAYAALEKITMPESFYRRDIGAKGLRRLAGKN